MSARSRKSDAHRAGGSRGARTAEGVVVRKVAGENVWELVHPRRALDRQDDLDEVIEMISGGETEVAIDELRWLLEDCRDFIAAHRLLGELHLADNDLELARAHFGFAYQIGLGAVAVAARPNRPKISAGEAVEILKLPGPLPYERPANQFFYEAAKGLVYCLGELNIRQRADEICRQMLALDPSDPLGFAKLNQLT